MANKLADTLANNKKLIKNKQGQVQEVTNQTLGQLASQKNMLSPINPLQATMLGANKDQAKMAGTPAQINNLSNQLSQPKGPIQDSKSLTLAKQQQSESGYQQSLSQQLGKEKSQNLQALTGLGDRINTYIGNAIKQMTGASTPPTSLGDALTNSQQPINTGTSTNNTLVQDKGPSEFTDMGVGGGSAPEYSLYSQPNTNNTLITGNGITDITLADSVQDPQLADALNRLKAGDTSALDIVAKSLNKTPDQLTFNDFVNLYKDPTGDISKKVAALLPDTIKFDASVLGDLGYTNAQLSELLGVPDVSQLSISEVDNLVQDQAAQVNNEIMSLQAKIQDPTLSAQDKELLNDRLREFGYVGASATQEEFDNLVQELETDQQIEMGDETYSLEELLSDPTITGMMDDYLNDPEGLIGKELKEKYPDLTNFVDQNKNAIKGMFDQMGSDTREAIDNYKYNLNLKNTDAGPLSDSLMNQLMPGWNEWSDQKKTEVPPVLSYLNDKQIPPEKRTTFLNRLSAADGDPNLLKALNSFTPEQITAYGLDDVNNKAGYDNWVNAVKTDSRMKAVESNLAKLHSGNFSSADVDAVMDAYFGKDVDTKKLFGTLNNAKQLGDILGEGINLPEGVDPVFWAAARDPSGIARTVAANMRTHLDPTKVKQNRVFNNNPDIIMSGIQAQIPMLKAKAPAKIEKIRKVDAPLYAEHIKAQEAKVNDLAQQYQWALDRQPKRASPTRINTTDNRTILSAAQLEQNVQNKQKALQDAQNYLKQLQTDRDGMLMQAQTLEGLLGVL
jgi:hypothetical protein